MIQKCSSSSSGQQKITRLHLCQRQSGEPSCPLNSSSETRWWGAWHCNGHFFPQVRCKDVGAPVWESGGSNLRPVPICIVNASRHRLPGQSQTRTPCARCCPSMALVLTTMCTEAPCWLSFQFARVASARPSYPCQPTSYVWEDEAGVQHRIIQAEGGEQGDPPLVPLLFSLAIYDPLQQAQREFRADENFFVLLDDVHFTSAVAQRMTASERSCMITQASNFTQGRRPEGMAEFGPEVWNPEGMKVLGILVGSTRFVEEVVNKRLEEEAKLWEAIPFVCDLQAVWQILLLSRHPSPKNMRRHTMQGCCE